MTNPNLTEIIAILDRSGSMQSVRSDTEGAFNAYVAEQRSVAGQANLTLVQFDHEIDSVYRTRPLSNVPLLTLHPRGSTALYDAIGRTVVEAGERFAKLPEAMRPGKVIVLILTDGAENASKDWTAETLKPLVEEQINKYGWTFLFLGANMDAVFEGAKFGVPSATSLTYDTKNMAATVNLASTASSTVRRTGKFRGYTEKDRKTAIGAIGDGS